MYLLRLLLPALLLLTSSQGLFGQSSSPKTAFQASTENPLSRSDSSAQSCPPAPKPSPLTSRIAAHLKRNAPTPKPQKAASQVPNPTFEPKWTESSNPLFRK